MMKDYPQPEGRGFGAQFTVSRCSTLVPDEESERELLHVLNMFLTREKNGSDPSLKRKQVYPKIQLRRI